MFCGIDRVYAKVVLVLVLASPRAQYSQGCGWPREMGSGLSGYDRSRTHRTRTRTRTPLLVHGAERRSMSDPTLTSFHYVIYVRTQPASGLQLLVTRVSPVHRLVAGKVSQLPLSFGHHTNNLNDTFNYI